MNISLFFGLFALFVVIVSATFYVLTLGVSSARRQFGQQGRQHLAEQRLSEASQRVTSGLVQLGQWMIARAEGWTGARLSTRYQAITRALDLQCRRAGFRENTAVRILVGSQFLGLLLLPILGVTALLFSGKALTPWLWGLLFVVLAGLGATLPIVALRWRAYKRKQEIVHSFPEALDLIMICVEAGLGLDSAIQRVGDEFRVSCPPLYDEFRTLSLELRSGVLRAHAFQNLADRIDLHDIRNVVTTLTQADRLGTSLLEAVRVQADQLRLHRRLKAEERAAKIGTKLLFPLIFFLFPALFLVLVGPAILSIIDHFPRVVSP